MAIIEATELTKTYRVFQKQEGVLGAMRGLYPPRVQEVTRGRPDQLHASSPARWSPSWAPTARARRRR